MCNRFSFSDVCGSGMWNLGGENIHPGNDGSKQIYDTESVYYAFKVPLSSDQGGQEKYDNYCKAFYHDQCMIRTHQMHKLLNKNVSFSLNAKMMNSH